MAIKSAEWGEIVTILKKNYNKPWFLPDKATADRWFNHLLSAGAEYSDVLAAVDELIATRRSTELPELPDLLAAVQAVKKERIQEEYEEETSYKEICKNCENNGYTLKIYPNGSEYLIPCGCRIGRHRYPWAFKTISQLKEDYQNMRKKDPRASDVYFNSRPLDPAWENAYLNNVAECFKKKKKVPEEPEMNEDLAYAFKVMGGPAVGSGS